MEERKPLDENGTSERPPDKHTRTRTHKLSLSFMMDGRQSTWAWPQSVTT